MPENKIKILQIGQENWEESYFIPRNLTWHYTPIDFFRDQLISEDGEKVEPFQVILFTDFDLGRESFIDLFPFSRAYTVFYNQEVKTITCQEEFFFSKQAQPMDMTEVDKLLLVLSKFFFTGQSGSSADMRYIQVCPKFVKKVSYLGNSYLTYNEDYGQDFMSLQSWRYNILYSANEPIDLWLEYIKDQSVKLQLKVYSFQAGSSEVIKIRTFTEKDLEHQLHIDDGNENTYLSVVLLVKGSGQLKVGPLHQRRSRLSFGQFIAGGKRLVDENRQELIAYFNPGDMKPPLNVYFSGYRSAEGFEGYWMMANMGNAPFILIGDPRIEGGAFYLGSQDLEKQVQLFIEEKLKELGFGHHQLILSGLSMGTFGASYYAAQLRPHAVIIGKPLFSLGNIALNGYRLRPDEFGTAFDMVHLLRGELSDTAIQAVNQKFWTAFDQADFSHTLFAIAYMKNDDYDSTAYYDLLEHINSKNVKVISKGIEGRHNDNSDSINQWFLNQYKRILKLDFGRDS
ncbi:accessory Sec system protein Asp2 [Streptococcus catagoni]|uniref:accessory Sec system protein Asp2 n=1 Tax=Streptococcus catagoni TaxID=2654874 RepID=UPI00140C1CC6|nr:accessory Sec system protein Asp2 [Streptococcus catagoni]